METKLILSDEKDLNDEHYCFICGKHKTQKCVGGITGRVLPVKHDAKLVRSNPAAIRRKPLYIVVPNAD